MKMTVATSPLMSSCGTLLQDHCLTRGAMPKARAKQVLKAYALRLPSDLYDAIAALAAEDVRPINSEMIVLLRDAVAMRQGQKQRQDDLQDE